MSTQPNAPRLHPGEVPTGSAHGDARGERGRVSPHSAAALARHNHAAGAQDHLATAASQGRVVGLGRTSGQDGDVERLGKALAGEHAAVFAYGLIGARTTGALRARATRAFDAHRARRDQLRGFISGRGGKPAEPEASYSLPVVPSRKRRPSASPYTWRRA